MRGPGRLVSWGLAEEGRPEPARTGAGDSRLRVLPCAALRPRRAIHWVLLLMLTSFFPDVAKLKVPRNPKRCPAPNASHGGRDYRGRPEAANPGGLTFRLPWAHGRVAAVFTMLSFLGK